MDGVPASPDMAATLAYVAFAKLLKVCPGVRLDRYE